MQNITNQLAPKERALLYTAMLFLKNQSELFLSQSILEDWPTVSKEFYKYTEAELKLLMQKLFGECFPEDLDFINHFNVFWKTQHDLKVHEMPLTKAPATAHC